MLYNDFKSLITCGKTGTLSSMRFINVVGSIILLFCIVYAVLNNFEKDKLLILIGGFCGLNGAKVWQSYTEKKE